MQWQHRAMKTTMGGGGGGGDGGGGGGGRRSEASLAVDFSAAVLLLTDAFGLVLGRKCSQFLQSFLFWTLDTLRRFFGIASEESV